MLLGYYELLELARICSHQAQITETEHVARMLRRMARQYLREATELDGGKVPDIGLVCLKEAWRRQPNPSGYRTKLTPGPATE
jgi:hypothetical protein